MLVRKLTVLPTSVGESPFQVEYEDYRDAGNGVKLAFVIHMFPATPRTELGVASTVRIQKVEENVPIEANYVFTGGRLEEDDQFNNTYNVNLSYDPATGLHTEASDHCPVTVTLDL